MKKSWRFGLLAMFFVLTSLGTVGASEWWLDSHYQTDRVNSQSEAEKVVSFMDDETYEGIGYSAIAWEDWNESSILDDSLPWCKVWHIACHGSIDFETNTNWLSLASGEKIEPDEIPPLDEVAGGGPMLFASCSACYAGRNLSGPNLREAFLDQGARAYMGWWGWIGVYDAYDFVKEFYDQVDDGRNLYDARKYAIEHSPVEKFDIVLAGDSSLRLVDD